MPAGHCQDTTRGPRAAFFCKHLGFPNQCHLFILIHAGSTGVVEHSLLSPWASACGVSLPSGHNFGDIHRCGRWNAKISKMLGGTLWQTQLCDASKIGQEKQLWVCPSLVVAAVKGQGHDYLWQPSSHESLVELWCRVSISNVPLAERMVTWSCHLRVASGSWQLDLTNIFQDNKTVLPWSSMQLRRTGWSSCNPR